MIMSGYDSKVIKCAFNIYLRIYDQINLKTLSYE